MSLISTGIGPVVPYILNDGTVNVDTTVDFILNGDFSEENLLSFARVAGSVDFHEMLTKFAANPGAVNAIDLLRSGLQSCVAYTDQRFFALVQEGQACFQVFRNLVIQARSEHNLEVSILHASLARESSARRATEAENQGKLASMDAQFKAELGNQALQLQKAVHDMGLKAAGQALDAEASYKQLQLTVTRELTSLKLEQLAALQATEAKYEGWKHEMSNELSKLRNDVVATQKSAKDSESLGIAAVTTALDEVRTAGSRLSTQVKTQDSKQKALESTFAADRDELSNTKAALEALRGTVTGVKEQVSSLRAVVGNEEARQQEELASLNAKIAEQRSKIERLTRDVSLIDARLDEVSDDDEAEKEREKKAEEVKMAEAVIRRLREEKKILSRSSFNDKEAAILDRLAIIEANQMRSETKLSEIEQKLSSKIHSLIERIGKLEAKGCDGEDELVSPVPRRLGLFETSHRVSNDNSMGDVTRHKSLAAHIGSVRFSKVDFDNIIKKGEYHQVMRDIASRKLTLKWCDTTTMDVMMLAPSAIPGFLALPLPYAFPLKGDDDKFLRIVEEVAEKFISETSDSDLEKEAAVVRKKYGLWAEQIQQHVTGGRQLLCEFLVCLCLEEKGLPSRMLDMLRRARHYTRITPYDTFVSESRGSSPLTYTGENGETKKTRFSSFQYTLCAEKDGVEVALTRGKSEAPKKSPKNVANEFKNNQGRGGKGGGATGVNDAGEVRKN